MSIGIKPLGSRVVIKKIEAEEKTASGICPRCGSPLVTRNGKRGEFIGCSAYPKCRFTKNI